LQRRNSLDQRQRQQAGDGGQQQAGQDEHKPAEEAAGRL
jgi:hypothetical protein